MNKILNMINFELSYEVRLSMRVVARGIILSIYGDLFYSFRWVDMQNYEWTEVDIIYA